MSSAKIPASANIICQHGNDILLIKRSPKAKAWPNFWGFPGGKVDDHEFFRDAGIRELEEEIGISFSKNHISQETILLNRTVQGTKIYYFGCINEWNGMPEICEKHLASDMAWFPLHALPKNIIPHHYLALQAIHSGIHFQEIDFTP